MVSPVQFSQGPFCTNRKCSPKEKEAATTHIRLRNVHRPPLQIRPPVRARIEPLAERDGRRRLTREVCDLEGVGGEEGFFVRSFAVRAGCVVRIGGWRLVVRCALCVDAWCEEPSRSIRTMTEIVTLTQRD